ncbi:carboxylating nicotinate-nucleotide diphosphorylase [Papillibacter cinnamivorans]|uniref:Probable nicotinate-nucleotide pyrophosphorylase [carboxylating] n=1 Tax=Papillibacter cinnamivorans DSM 12816 TaxID=1122930 RepID=A0A1W1ZE60_9FIRM|nr:carboxylating nicotinate-nucleotide diphosphorylase [Papillibacter cinnamivorans]SMC46451.1 nicotinate-nucleotide pyrophosphorylase [carboxylating] [Papillibacter cinnamivorans DSM 12816]
MNYLGLDRLLMDALEEDIGTGDITTLSCVPAGSVSRGVFRAKEDLVVCGLEVLRCTFLLVDPEVSVTFLTRDGDFVNKGDIIAEISGPSRSVLTGERTALNLLQRLSGVATVTARAVKAVSGTGARIADTRKTTPGLRVLEKYAVKTGGGANHRFGLSDGVLIKDNHIVAAGGIAPAVDAVRKNAPHTLKIEVETSNLDEVEEALSAGADIIMLDNMDYGQMAEAVLRIGGRALVEASGNMGDKDLRKVAETGVDIISIGALTHSPKASDISLQFAK